MSTTRRDLHVLVYAPRQFHLTADTPGHLRPPPGAEEGHRHGDDRHRLATPGALHAQRVGPGATANAERVAAAIRTIFAQPDAAAVTEQFERIVATLERQFPEVTAMLVGAREDLLAFAAFPLEHWRKLWSTNPVRHEALLDRVEMKGLHLRAVAAA